MEQKIATTTEQSKRLMELGADPLTCDMCWLKIDENCTDNSNEPLIVDGFELKSGSHPAIRMKTFSFRNGYIVPAWSINALMNLIQFEVNLHRFNTENGKTYRAESFECGNSSRYDNPIDAVFEIACKALERDKENLIKETVITEER